MAKKIKLHSSDNIEGTTEDVDVPVFTMSETDTDPVPVKTSNKPKKQPSQSPPSTLNKAQELWDRLKTTNLDLFGLPGQTLEKHATFAHVEPSKLYLTMNTSAATPALEIALGSKYVVEVTHNFVTISEAT